MSELMIREATAEDAAAIRSVYAPYVESTVITFEYQVPSVEEFRRRIAHTQERYPYFVAVEDGRVLGYAYAGPFVGRPAYDWSAELSIYVDCHLRKKGLGKKLYGALLEALKKWGSWMCTPVSAIRNSRTNTWTSTAPSSMPIWGLNRWGSSKTAATSSTAGTI